MRDVNSLKKPYFIVKICFFSYLDINVKIFKKKVLYETFSV